MAKKKLVVILEEDHRNMKFHAFQFRQLPKRWIRTNMI